MVLTPRGSPDSPTGVHLNPKNFKNDSKNVIFCGFFVLLGDITGSTVYRGVPEHVKCVFGDGHTKYPCVDPKTVRNGHIYKKTSNRLQKPILTKNCVCYGVTRCISTVSMINRCKIVFCRTPNGFDPQGVSRLSYRCSF